MNDAPRAKARVSPGRYSDVRRATLELVQPLSVEDMVAQSMPDASPAKWHLAHTTWFFETFVLERWVPGYQPFDPAFRHLYNSYYHGVGEQFPRPLRGLLTRPSVDTVRAYRDHVDAAVARLLTEDRPDVSRVVELGLHHEQQHQELLLTDVLHLLSCNPSRPAYQAVVDHEGEAAGTEAPPSAWVAFDECVKTVGHAGDGFHFDNEAPAHRVLVLAFELADRLVTNREFMAFIDDGGYQRPNLWLDAGWAAVRREHWTMPAYWGRESGSYSQFTLRGEQPLALDAPVCHVSHFEADAFARWADARLPTEFEWEVASAAAGAVCNLRERGTLRPLAARREPGVRQMIGDVWEWTASAYLPYPGYRPSEGSLGEYNGKFMSGQVVLRGGSCATPESHVRPTYRNFFPPEARWQFSGIRLAR